MKLMKQESVLISKELVSIHGMNSGELSYYSLVPASWLMADLQLLQDLNLVSFHCSGIILRIHSLIFLLLQLPEGKGNFMFTAV